MTPYREGAWTDVAEPRSAPAGGWRLALEAFGVLLVAAPASAFAAPVGLALPTAAIIVGGGTAGLASRHLDARRRAAGERARSLRDGFGPGPVWAVELMVRQGGAPTGADQGLMWVEDGRIVFSGLRTSFALAPAQMAGIVRHLPRRAGLRHRLNLDLAHETAAGPLSLSFWPLAPSLQGAENDATDLRAALNTVAKRRDHALAATGQWPPVTRGPGAPTRRDLLVRATGPIAAWIALGATFGASILPNATGALAAFLFVAGVGNVAYRDESLPRWRAYRAHRRLFP